MKYINFIKIGLVLFLMMPFLSFADGGYRYYDRDHLRGTYIYEGSLKCVTEPDGNLDNEDIDATGEFTLDGKGNYVSRNDYIFRQAGSSNMGQASDSCTGEYFVERVNYTTVVKIPKLVCVGKTTFGLPGAEEESEPLVYINYAVENTNYTLKFQKYRKAGTFSAIPPEGVALEAERITFTDFGTFTDRRCSRNFTFFRKGRFSKLTPVDPAEVEMQPE